MSSAFGLLGLLVYDSFKLIKYRLNIVEKEKLKGHSSLCSIKRKNAYK
jgi:hypothetical protein